MAALVQSFPSPTSTLTMLQSRSPSTEAFQAGPPSQQHQRGTQMPRNIYNSSVGGMAASSYRGHTTTGPVAPYAFTSTPILPNAANPLRQHPAPPPLRHENRTSSAPVVPLTKQFSNPDLQNLSRQRPPAINLIPQLPLDLSHVLSLSPKLGSKDDNSLSTSNMTKNIARPLSAIELNSPSLSSLSLHSEPARPLPERYRRNYRRTEKAGQQSAHNLMPSGSGASSGPSVAPAGHLYTNPLQSSSTPSSTPYPAFHGSLSSHAGNEVRPQPRFSSFDDMNLPKQSMSEQAKRYRRKSVSNLEVTDPTVPDANLHMPFHSKTSAAQPSPVMILERKDTFNPPPLQRQSSHARHDSIGSSNSSRSTSRPSSSTREAPLTHTATPTALQATPVAKHEAKLISIPSRGSSDGNKRITTPSPLSRPMGMSSEKQAPIGSLAAPRSTAPLASPSNPGNTPNANVPGSSAAQHLAALNKKDVKREGKPSRLRRAFSFGSAAELRKASAENILNNNERAKLRKDRYHNEQEANEAQQAEIAQKQEAAGLGEGIYSGQGQFFTGSTDNLSISSTASSASIMIRKMGKGMKKGSRSLVGLFRPKSVAGAPPAESPVPEPTVALVSMVTVEAEREKVNVNASPHDQIGGGTGFPKLERNSMETGSEVGTIAQEHVEIPRLRRSIVGGEKERAEVLAAVKKGILKRSGTDSESSSPVTRPVDSKITDLNIPQLPSFAESPGSTVASTPADEQPRLGHRRTDSVTIEGEDYFLSLAKYANGGSKSMPGTPRSLVARNISFSPTIQLHDTWGCLEYDRRGDIATCNRLTPMLAQQIKEELNTFKMEMEVHEMSKVYTHFF